MSLNQTERLLAAYKTFFADGVVGSYVNGTMLVGEAEPIGQRVSREVQNARNLKARECSFGSTRDDECRCATALRVDVFELLPGAVSVL